MITTTHSAARIRKFVAVGAALTGALLLLGGRARHPGPGAPHRRFRASPALPGPLVDPGKPAATMGVLKAAPDTAVPGTALTISGTGLPANKTVSIVWTTASIRWVLDAKPDSVDYIGRKVDPISVVLATATTDATGAFSVELKAPQDFGGIHDVYAVVDGTQVAKGGFLLARTVKISPDARADRHDDHGHRHGNRLPPRTRVSAQSSTTTTTPAPCRRTRPAVWPMFQIRASGARRCPLDRVRRLQPHGAVPQHGSVADSVDRLPTG